MNPQRSSGSCHARAAVAGNPSDLHGGAVVAVPVRSVRAEVSLAPSPTFEIPGFPSAPESLTQLEADAVRLGCGEDQPLVAAALIALRRALDATVDPVRVEVETSIPRNVGLAGSSAIVIAALRAAIRHHHEETWAMTLREDPALLAEIALDAETSVLDIAAGPQDRLVQSLDDAVLMDFAEWTQGVEGRRARWSRLQPLPGHWFVACREDHATESGEVHRNRPDRPSGIATATADLARLAHDAAAAVAVGDVTALGRTMVDSFDVRARHMPLDPAHVEMMDLAAATGVCANYSGSGGAITVLAASVLERDRAVRALQQELGCRVIDLADPHITG